MGFQFKGSLSYEDTHKRARPLSWNGVTGLQTRYRVFQSTPGTGSILIHFTPSGARSFLRQPASEVHDLSVPLSLVTDVRNLEQLQDDLFTAMDDQTRLHAVESYLERIWEPSSEDQLVSCALSTIHKRGGLIRIQNLADILGTSLSPLERRFKDIVGTSPKRYAGLVRLNTLFDLIAGASGSFAELALRMGFHDQSHFIHEFKSMTGLTPQSFLEQQPPKDEFLQFED